MSSGADAGSGLGRFRSYLRLLARMHCPTQLAHKIDASDIAQETLLRAHRAREAFRGATENELAAWLRTILKNTLTDELERLGRQKRDAARERSLQAAIEHSSARIEEWLAADGTSPSQGVQREERMLALAEALESLPTLQRLAVEARYLQGMSIRSISAQMQRSEASVAGLIRRGLKSLRALLGEVDED